MHFEEKTYLHIKLTDYQYEVLKNLARALNMPVSKLLNQIIHKLSRVIDRDFNLKIDYSCYLSVIDKVDGDKDRIVSPHISLTRKNHLFLRNIKNRNFRASFAMLIRLLIEELLSGEDDVEGHHSPFSYATYTILTQEIQLIAPLPEEILKLLL